MFGLFKKKTDVSEDMKNYSAEAETSWQPPLIYKLDNGKNIVLGLITFDA